MPTRFEGSMPIEVSENGSGQVCIKQTNASGEEQMIELELGQAEHLANWCIQYAQTVMDGLMEE